MISAQNFLPVTFNVAAASLGIDLAEVTTLEVMRVNCGDQPWHTIGGMVLWDKSDHGFAVFDGVFFEIEPAG